MSKSFDNLKRGDMIYITGVETNLYECNDDNYDTLLGVVNQFCKVVAVRDNVDLYVLSENSEKGYCMEIGQRGVLIQNPKLQGHDGGGRCPEYNCFWIGKEYVSFDVMSMDETSDIFDQLNESEKENIKEIKHDDLELNMVVLVDGFQGKHHVWENKVGKVVKDYRQPDEDDEDTPSNSLTIAFEDWFEGHDGNDRKKCGHNRCWSFYDDCAYSDSNNDGCQNIDNVKFYTVDIGDIFNQLNESEDELGWAEETVKDTPEVVDYRVVKEGDKVLPGKDWLFGNQADGAVYGVVDLEEYGGEPKYIEDSTDQEFHQYWVYVSWVNKKGDLMFRNNYRVGPKYYDLKYYDPNLPRKKKKIKESEDELDWVEEIMNEPQTYGTLKDFLDIGDEVLLSGYIYDEDGTPMVNLEKEPFVVLRQYDTNASNYQMEMRWINDQWNRPVGWEEITIMHNDSVSFGKNTYVYDKDLIVEVTYKKENPF